MSDKECEALVVALAHIRWQSFGECRTPGHPYTPPTAADAVATIQAALDAPEAEQEQCPTCSEYQPHTGTCGTSDNDTKALCKRKAPPPSAQELSDEAIIAIWDAWPRQGITSRPRAVEFARAILAAKAQGGSHG